MAEGVHFPIPRWQRALQWKCSFGDDDDRGIVARKSTFDERTHLVDVERAFGDEDGVCTPGNAGMPRNPACVTSHDFDNEDTVVTFRRRMQPIDGFSGNCHRGVKPKRVVGGSQIVVDGLWYATTGMPIAASLVATPKVSYPR